VTPWHVPLPGPGIELHLRSGARLRPDLESEDPWPLLDALAEAGGVAAAREAQLHPWIVWAHARHARARGLLDHPLFKFPVFGLLPAGVLFNAHQHIAYGGSLGQWRLEGPAAFAATAFEYWATVCVYLLLYASVCRVFGELCALLAARAGEARAASVRRVVERVCGALYYAGVPALVLARFLL
jgi:hypothetical protein